MRNRNLVFTTDSLSNPYIFKPDCGEPLIFQTEIVWYNRISTIENIGLQRYRVKEIRVCGKVLFRFCRKQAAVLLNYIFNHDTFFTIKTNLLGSQGLLFNFINNTK